MLINHLKDRYLLFGKSSYIIVLRIIPPSFLSHLMHNHDLYSESRRYRWLPLVRQSIVQGHPALASRWLRRASCACTRVSYTVRGSAIARTAEIIQYSSSLRSREGFGDVRAWYLISTQVGDRPYGRRRKWERGADSSRARRKRTSQYVLQSNNRSESDVQLDGQEAREWQRGDTRAETRLSGCRERGGSREKEQYQVHIFLCHNLQLHHSLTLLAKPVCPLVHWPCACILLNFVRFDKTLVLLRCCHCSSRNCALAKCIVNLTASFATAYTYTKSILSLLLLYGILFYGQLLRWIKRIRFWWV